MRLKLFFSTSDRFIIKAYKLSNFFNLINNNLNFLSKCRNKLDLLKLLKKSGFVNRNFGRVNFNKKRFRNKLIIKPNSGTGSTNIYKFKPNEDVIKHKLNLLKDKDFYIFEDFVKGQEYSLEVLIFQNELIFKQLIKKQVNSKFVEIGHLASNRIDNFKIKQQNLLLNYLKRLKLDTCFLHIELKFINNKIEIIEINPRMCGGNISELILITTKIDLIKNFLDLIKKRKFKKSNFKKRFDKDEYKIHYLIPDKDKKIKKIIISKCSKIIKQDLYNDKIKKFIYIKNNFEDRIAHIIYKNEKNFNIKKRYQIIYE
jgi:hypothetical protein